jgi:hypothetical protein
MDVVKYIGNCDSKEHDFNTEKIDIYENDVVIMCILPEGRVLAP